MSRRIIMVLILAIAVFLMPSYSYAKKDKYFPESKVEYINTNWWKQFNDELLLKYILMALDNNSDIKIARLKACELKQEMNKNVSSEFPTLNVGANYLGLKIPRTIFPMEGFRNNAFVLPFFTTWEIDIFGKTLDKIKMAKEDFKASVWDEKGICLSIAADVATLYFNIANLNEQIDIQNEIINIKTNKMKRYHDRFNSGVIGVKDLNDAKIELEYETVVLADYLKQREGFKSKLAFIISKNPMKTEEIVVGDIKYLDFRGKIPDVLNGEIVANRPDLMRLDSEIKKANIDARLARKAFLPNINVVGVLVFSTLTPNFGWPGAVAELLAGANQSIFQGGKRIFELKQKKLSYEKSLENYLRGDLNALKEVNDAMYDLKADTIVYNTNLRSLSYESNNFVRVSNSFSYGTAGYLDVIDEQNTFLLEKSRVYNSKTQKLVDLVFLYKSVGGAL